MKTKLLLFFGLFFGVISAQNLTMTQTGYEPAIGDINSVYPLDTSFYTSGLPNNIIGNNVTWDFSNLAVSQTIASASFVDPSTLTVTVPVGSTFAEDQNGSYTFFKSTTTPTTQTELLSVKINTIALTFTNTGIIARYPISYGYTLSDPVAGSITFSISANFTGNITTTADGQGTLKMPQGHTFTNILRLKSVQTITATVFSFPIGTVNQTTYSYYHSTAKFPILTVNNTATTFSSQTTNATTANGNAAFLDVGIKTNYLNSVNFGIYPNPAINSVFILLENNQVAESVSIINSIGQKVKSYNNVNQISVSELPRGIYYMEIKSNGFYGRKPFVITN